MLANTWQLNIAIYFISNKQGIWLGYKRSEYCIV
jgi:hypothetical protein